MHSFLNIKSIGNFQLKKNSELQQIFEAVNGDKPHCKIKSSGKTHKNILVKFSDQLQL